jgi:hypothetical protein
MKKKTEAADKVIICRPDYGTQTETLQSPANYFSNMEESDELEAIEETAPEPESIEETAPEPESIEEEKEEYGSPYIECCNYMAVVLCSISQSDNSSKLYGQIRFNDGRIGKNKFLGFWRDGFLQISTDYEGAPVVELVMMVKPNYYGTRKRPTEKSRYFRIISGEKIYYCIGKGAAQKFREEKDANAEISEIWLTDKEADEKFKSFYSPRVVSKVIKRK